MDFLILKVNGQDVSKSSHEDAVRTFQTAQEPIVVEVLRRAAAGGLRNDANRNPRPEPASGEQGVTVSTQTEPWPWPCSPEFPPAPPFIEDDDIDESFEDGGEPDVDFEEVTLRRSSASERLGLTLYYPDGDDAPDETDVLVRSVEAGGIAARDGRIQPGDQIIQINGEEVASKEQAERLLAARPDVLLLLCRPAEQGNEEAPTESNEADGGMKSPQNNCQQNIDNRVVESLSPGGDGERGSLEKRDTMKSGGSSSSGGSGGSGSGGSRGRRPADRSPAAGELTIDRELYLVNKQMVCIQQECESLAQRRWGDRRRDLEDHIYETIPEASEPEEPVYCQPYVAAGAPARPDAGRARRDVERWVRATAAPEPAAAEPEEGLEPWHRTSSTNDSQSSAESKPARRGRGKEAADEKDSSSAYNTGDSSRSTPLTLELGLVTDEASREARESTLTLAAPPAAPTRDHSLQVSLDSDTYSEVSCKNCRKCMRLPPLQQTPTKNKNIINSVNAVEKNRNYVTFLPYQTHYTNAANLEETMQRQQRQLYQQIMRRSQPRAPPASPAQPTARPPPFGTSLRQYHYVSSPGGAPRNHSQTLPADRGQDEPQFQYKVKVRSDGSRYIARRPVRKQLLKDRAARIAEERTGVTTDDDAMSELKLGRYWPRDEKKRQLERARERKQKQQQRTKMAAVPEEAVTDEISGIKRQGVHQFVEPSLQRRSTTSSMRKKPHGQEEFLKHTKPPKTTDALLSVTTV